MKRLAFLLLLPVLGTPAQAARHRWAGPVSTPREARLIAERETHGQAVEARRIHLNGASGGWEVDVRMPGEDRGWRCTIDNDTRMVRSRTRIPNPEAKKSRR